jgi:negative regulator of sigma E activity
MKDLNERPICHRAEDLVTYLYNEGSAADATDFAAHAEACEACRAELAVFAQVHESILLWRNEALGAAFNLGTAPAPPISSAAADTSQLVQHEPRLSALDAVREFFRVSPLWFRGATAFAGLTLVVLAALFVLRSWNQPAPLVNNQPEPGAYSQQQFEAAVTKEVKRQMDEMRSQEPATQVNATATTSSTDEKTQQPQVGVNRTPKTNRSRGLTRQEREQLAADLRLIPRDEDELPFSLADEPKQ